MVPVRRRDKVVIAQVRPQRSSWSPKRILLANTVRMPAAMAPLAIVLSEGDTKRALAAGSLLVSIFTIGEIFLSSRFAKLGDRTAPVLALVRLLAPLALVWTIFVLLSPQFGNRNNFIALSILAFLVGGLGAGLFGIARNLILVKSPQHIEHDPIVIHRIIGVDTVIMEMFFLVAPLIVSSSIILGGSRATGISTTAIVLIGLLASLISSRQRENHASESVVKPQPKNTKRIRLFDSVWFYPKATWIFVASAAMGVGEGGLIIAVPTIFVEKKLGLGYVGLDVAMISLGSIVGGSITTQFARLFSRARIRVRLGTYLLGLLSAVIAVTTLNQIVPILLATFVAGLFVAPLNTTRALAIEAVVPDGKKSEAFGALYGSYSIGFALVGMTLGALSLQASASNLLAGVSFMAFIAALFLVFFTPIPNRTAIAFESEKFGTSATSTSYNIKSSLVEQ